MGKETVCAARVDGRADDGKALLEGDHLLFRGASRVKVPLGAVREVRAAKGWLRVAWSGGALELDLGAQAAKWAEAILHPKSRTDKLGVKPGQRVSLLGVKDGALAVELRALGADVSMRARKDSDAVFVQMDEPAALARFDALRAGIAQDGAVWALTPRAVPGLKDTDVMAAAKKAGLVDVKVVRFSETHTANKFVIPRAERR